LIGHGTVPCRRPAKLDEPIGFQIVAVKTDFLSFVQRPDGPNYGLRSVRQYRTVQFITGLQRSLIRNNAVAVHQRRIQQSHRIRVFLRDTNNSELSNKFGVIIYGTILSRVSTALIF